MMSAAFESSNQHEQPWGSAERLRSEDAALWATWRTTLGEPLASEIVPALETVLSGLIAFRRLNNLGSRDADAAVKARLRTFHAACRQALEYTRALLETSGSRTRMRAATSTLATEGSDPISCLEELHEALRTADIVSAGLVELDSIDSASFEAAYDVLLVELYNNRFFAPAAPLEFTDAKDLASESSFLPSLRGWRSELARVSVATAILALVRCHKRLNQVRALVESDRAATAHVVLAAVRRELRAITHFLLGQGVDVLAQEFEARLLERPTEANSDRIAAFRQRTERLAIDLHASSRDALDSVLPTLEDNPRQETDLVTATASLQRVQELIKTTAVALRETTTREAHNPVEDVMQTVRLRDEVWTFRFILRGFAAKASTPSLAASLQEAHGGDTTFVGEFCRHFEVFAPHITKNTGYGRRENVIHAIDELERASVPTPTMLNTAAQEALRLAAHLDEVFKELNTSEALRRRPFDKRLAASVLRRYLLSVGRLPLAKATANPPASAFKTTHARSV